VQSKFAKERGDTKAEENFRRRLFSYKYVGVAFLVLHGSDLRIVCSIVWAGNGANAGWHIEHLPCEVLRVEDRGELPALDSRGRFFPHSNSRAMIESHRITTKISSTVKKLNSRVYGVADTVSEIEEA